MPLVFASYCLQWYKSSCLTDVNFCFVVRADVKLTSTSSVDPINMISGRKSITSDRLGQPIKQRDVEESVIQAAVVLVRTLSLMSEVIAQ